MINIEKFVTIRKKMGLSQTELSEGICTQATLSKFENLGRVPSMRIMTQLCDRLKISLSDLMEERSSSEITTLFAKADFQLITYDYAAIRQLLLEIDFDKLSPTEQWHYNYLRGSLAMLDEHDLIAGLFYFNAILTDANIDKESIYYLLALSGCGQIYELQDDTQKAEHYFDLVFELVMKKGMVTNQEAIQVLSILYHGGVFFSRKKDYDVSDSLLQYAYQICSENHHTFYLARILYQLAKNARETGQSETLFKEYINDAFAFARLNKNKHLLEKITALAAAEN